MASAITMFSHLQIPLKEVIKATNNFGVENIIGQGGFGKVYKGKLMHSGELINIVARRLDRKSGQGSVEFWTEISVLSSLKHKNLVSLIGFCDENREKVIINTREAKGSLSMHLSDPTLTWIQRLKICVDIASALRYIHNSEGLGYIVIHRNINSYTILLDDNWEAKLSGFEYSIKQSVNRMDRVVLAETIGTIGYVDPTIEQTGGVTHKSDVYSFGVVLCEILCGRKAFSPDDVNNRLLAPLFKLHYEKRSLNDIIHPDLRNQMAQKSLTSFSEAAYSCLKEDRVQRPNMNDIVIELEKALEHENLRKSLEHLKIPLSDIMLATNNFSEAFHYAYDDYCDSYRAELKYFDTEYPYIMTCSTVVIKRFIPKEDEEGEEVFEEGEEVFYTEIKMLNTCKHPSVVKLLGFCDEDSEMIVVVEHLSNGYLSDYWENVNEMPILTWATRLKICLDVANALNYLHTEMEDQKTIIHRDIKSRNIALDENLGAKIINFGFSVFLPSDQDDDALYHSLIVGAQDYMDPEYRDFGKLKRESDVYSFGVFLFEVICGRLAYDTIYLEESDKGMVFVARRCFQEGTILEMIDPILKEESGETNLNKSLEKFVKIAHKCIAETEARRPTMKVVIEELQQALFFQEEKLRPLDMVHVDGELEESMELKLTLSSYEEPYKEVSNEVKKSKELKLKNANLIKKLEHLKIPLGDIMLATENFFDTYLIRNTREYDLYVAKLEYFDKENPSIKEGTNKDELSRRHGTVVIKRILPSEDESGEEMFITEIEILTTCNHPNIVKLLGICSEGSEMILVIEHLSNGYLSNYWLEKINAMRHTLTWVKRLKICLDVANALNYLHNEMENQQRIIHRDFKSVCIALDENLKAKIVDFGLSVFLPPNQDKDTLYRKYVTGTKVYRDPEYWETGKLKRESDVYSFGVVLFEVLCGKLAERDDLGRAFAARQCFREGTLMEVIDPKLKERRGENSFSLNRGPNNDSLEKFVKIAHQCIAETQDQRPTMKVVINELQEALFFQENNKGEPIISLEDIKLATENFNDDNVIGGGGFGKVYKGRVPEGDGFNIIVAKRLDTRFGQGEQQFRTELQILFEYKHMNIITLLGYCDEKNEQIIVYEHASRGSLDRHLKDARLTWMKRLNICIDVATALDFIHGGAGKQAIVIHRDIKTENILLNDAWDAKLADFGLSLISPINKETDYVIDHACGTQGYLDPLYLKSGFLTKESDIYSFGVVLFEILCGRSTFEIRHHKGQFLPGFIKERFENKKHEDLVFEAIKKQIVPKALTAFQTIAYQCLHDDREKRPRAKEVLEGLKEAREFQISGSN